MGCTIVQIDDNFHHEETNPIPLEPSKTVMILAEIARKQIEDFAKAQGFHSVGFAASEEARTYPQFCEWLDLGYAASMGYLEKRRKAYQNPSGVLAGCRTVVLLTLPYQGHCGTNSVIKLGRKRRLGPLSSAESSSLWFESFGRCFPDA